MNVFAKIFAQIFDSSIADDYLVRHVFMDLLVLADRDGVVDMTPQAIARRTNVPEEVVNHAISILSSPDNRSRSDLEAGARIVLLDSHRDWGWQIVNYDHYRQIRDEESRKTYFRDKKRQYRLEKAKVSTSSPNLSTPVLDSPQKSTEGEGELEVEEETEVQKAPRARVARKTIPKGESFDGMELQVANELLREFRVPITNDMTQIAGQALVYECQRLGSPDKALDSMRTAMRTASGPINRFWFTDQHYDPTRKAKTKYEQKVEEFMRSEIQ